MDIVIIFAIVVLLAVIGILIVYNMNINKKIRTFSNINQKITSLNVLQNFMDILGEDVSVDQKIQNLNNIIVEKYDIRYSTIVIFDGEKYIIKATNVDEKYREVLSALNSSDVFRESITTAANKYLTISGANERLPYQTPELARSKSAIFFPMYMDNVYIGYWIIESEKPRAFDNVDTTILEVVKENIIKILKGVEYQNTFEGTVRVDEFSGLYSSEYLFGEGRKTLNKYATSAICMFNIVNLREINKLNRKLGDRIITEISNKVKENISSEYIFVRYLGPKFVIAFGGVEVESVENFIADIKEEAEEITLKIVEDAKTKKGRNVSPILNFVLTTYYKGTPLEGTIRKLEEHFLKQEDPNESSVNII